MYEPACMNLKCNVSLVLMKLSLLSLPKKLQLYLRTGLLIMKTEDM